MSNPSLYNHQTTSFSHFNNLPLTGGGEAELRQALLRTTAELESTRLAAQQELHRMETQTVQLTQLLNSTARERDELRRHCQALLLLLSNSDNNNNNTAVASGSEEDEGSNGTSPMPQTAAPPALPPAEVAALEEAAMKKGLPEKGRLVEAVVAAGPLLQTLLLAGPLPRWRHPPPAARGLDIPPFNVGKEVREEAESAPESSPESNCSLGKKYNCVGTFPF